MHTSTDNWILVRNLFRSQYCPLITRFEKFFGVYQRKKNLTITIERAVLRWFLAAKIRRTSQSTNSSCRLSSVRNLLPGAQEGSFAMVAVLFRRPLRPPTLPLRSSVANEEFIDFREIRKNLFRIIRNSCYGPGKYNRRTEAFVFRSSWTNNREVLMILKNRRKSRKCSHMFGSTTPVFDVIFSTVFFLNVIWV